MFEDIIGKKEKSTEVQGKDTTGSGTATTTESDIGDLEPYGVVIVPPLDPKYRIYRRN